MAKRRADLAFYKKLEILENYPTLPTSSQSASAEQLNIMSRGCLRNILCNEIALRSEAILSLLEGRDQKEQRHDKDQEVEEGFSN